MVVLFDFTLSALGIRPNTARTPDKSWAGVLSRKLRPVTTSASIESSRQPRHLIRTVYQERYKRDLSPERISFREKSKTSAEVDSNVMVSWVYTTVLFSVLLVQPWITIRWLIYNWGSERTYFMMSNASFSMIPVVQYVLSVRYFGTTHFEDFLEPKDDTIKIVLYLIYLMVILINVSSSFSLLNGNDTEFPGFEEYQNKHLIVTLLWLPWTIGRTTLYINLITFCMVFYKHCDILHMYRAKLDKNVMINALTINVITQEILRIRHDMENSIDLFKNIFSLFTLLGAVGFGFLVELISLNEFESFPWHQLVVYLVIQTVFLVIVNWVSNSKDDLSDYTRRPTFIDKFLRRYSPSEIMEKFDGDINMVILNIQEENASTLDWVVLNNIFNESWTEFKVMGIDITDGTLVKKGLVVVTLIVSALQFVNNDDQGETV